MATNATPSAATTPDGTDPPQPDSAQLAHLGNVTADYRHHAEQIDPAAGIALPGGFLKWYDVRSPDAAIRPETQDQARDFLRGEAAAGRLDLHDELGFVILHRRDGDTYFLIACTWRNDDEMWRTAFGRTGDGAFGLVEQHGAHRATQCVWELAPTAHERLAWSRYLDSARDETAKRAYLLDVCSGAA